MRQLKLVLFGLHIKELKTGSFKSCIITKGALFGHQNNKTINLGGHNQFQPKTQLASQEEIKMYNTAIATKKFGM